MNNFIKSMDDMNWILKLLLCLPVLDIVWAIYRIIKGANAKNNNIMIAGILWLVFGTTIMWIADFVCTCIYKKPTLLA